MFGNINPPPRVEPEPLKRSHVQAIKDATEERSKGNNENPSKKDGKGSKGEGNISCSEDSSLDDASYSTISSSPDPSKTTTSRTQPKHKEPESPPTKHIDVTV